MTTAASTSDNHMTGVDHIADKLTQSGWLRMEKNHSPFTVAVLGSLVAYGKGEESKVLFNQDKSLISVGEKLYLSEIRPQIEKLLKLGPANTASVEEEGKTKKGKKGGGKQKKGAGNKMGKDEIIEQKLKKDVVKYLPSLLKCADSEPKAREFLSELRVVQFMFYIDYCLQTLAKDPNSYVGYEGLIASHNSINSAQSKSDISPQAIHDAQVMRARLQDKVRFSYEELLTVYPRLIFSNLYAELYHEAMIEPYEDQKTVIDLLSTDQLLTFYTTVPGSGKTTAVAGVVARIMREQPTLAAKDDGSENPQLNLGRGKKFSVRKRFAAKKNEKGLGGRVVVFVCTNMLVREQVGRDAYNIDIPFAVAANKTYREHFNARTRDPVLIISDLETADMMLNKFPDPVLFVDEPTIAAENDHPINDMIMDLLVRAPRQTILSSATLPRPHEMRMLVETFSTRYSNIQVKTVTSNSIGIGCHAVHKGITLFPFEACKNEAQLKEAVEQLKTNPFLFRLLSIEVLTTIRYRMVDVGLPVEEWENVFPDPSSITHQAIALQALSLLERVLKTGSDEKIAVVCGPLTSTKYRPFSLATLLTADAHQHMQGALYATLQPLKRALELSEVFLKELPKVQDMLKDYNKRKEVHNKERANIEKRVKKEEEKQQQLQALGEVSMNIPLRFIPNTVDHIKKFAPSGTKYDPRAVQAVPFTSSILEDLQIPDEVLMLLYLGIGIYAPTCKELNPSKMDGIDTRYTEKVVELCSGGYISFLFADRSIVYGTNFPFSNVFIDPDFAETSSLNTLYQLIGRAGRVGRSYMAKVILVGEETKDRIVNFDEENIEAKHLEMALQRVLKNVDLKAEKTPEEEAQKVEEEAAQLVESAKKISLEKKKAVKEEEEEVMDDWDASEGEEDAKDGGEDEDEVDDWENL